MGGRSRGLKGPVWGLTAEQGARAAMADQRTMWAMVGSFLPPKIFLGRSNSRERSGREGTGGALEARTLGALWKCGHLGALWKRGH